ncbi:zinc finger CCCH domain-containing protein 48-like isoform X2 [Arachis duranensis]|uniref:Zinc finger CCCH domain-containing protein 48-like isoform X2 n=1 Tax=Arachis duranensis TaxID=130453 RepID=A0A9C6TFN5_ARADU|nr:zinc finger CCCH domain-containing protein 48-like isoform X2 [Arachis duranensis]
MMTAITLQVCTEKGFLKVAYTHDEKNAIVGLYGITDSYAKLISFYSCNDNSVCMYELRTWVTIKLASSCLANFVVMFLERAHMFSRTLL